MLITHIILWHCCILYNINIYNLFLKTSDLVCKLIYIICCIVVFIIIIKYFSKYISKTYFIDEAFKYLSSIIMCSTALVFEDVDTVYGEQVIYLRVKIKSKIHKKDLVHNISVTYILTKLLF